MSCVVTEGDEPLTVSWTFHGAELSSDLEMVTTPIGSRGSMLMISRVGHRHTGSYTCLAEVPGFPSISQTSRVKLRGPPRITASQATQFR